MKISLGIERTIAGIVFLYPVILFLVRGGMNASIFLIALLCIALLFTRANPAPLLDATSLSLGIAMPSLLFAILISQIYHREFVAETYDSPARFLLVVPIFMALRNVNIKSLIGLQFGFPLATITAFVLIMSGESYNNSSRAGLYFINEIHFGDLTLILGVLSALSINWGTKDSIYTLLFKIIGLFAGLVDSMLSGSRGGWLAIPFIILIWMIYKDHKPLFVKLTIAIVGSTLISLFSYFFIHSIHVRLNDVYSDLASFSQGNIDTSIGIRLQLWKAALHLFAENPIFGVGAEGFSRAMDTLSQSGYITSTAAQLGKGEVHNQILASLVRFGIFGLISILAVYLVPFYIFMRAARIGNSQQRTAAIMGMCLTLGFFIFGLTAEIFDLKMTAAFYSLTVSVLLAAAKNNSNSPASRSE